MASASVSEAEAEYEQARTEADAAFSVWVEEEVKAFRAWAIDQAKTFVSMQHEVSMRLGSDGVAEFRSAVESAVESIAKAIPAVYAEGRERNFAGDREPATRDLATGVAQFRPKLVIPLGEVISQAGYQSDHWGDQNWYVDGRLGSAVGFSLYFDRHGDADRALRRYSTAADKAARARANVSTIREQEARQAAADLW